MCVGGGGDGYMVEAKATTFNESITIIVDPTTPAKPWVNTAYKP